MVLLKIVLCSSSFVVFLLLTAVGFVVYIATPHYVYPIKEALNDVFLLR
jgi:hypothetical protein